MGGRFGPLTTRLWISDSYRKPSDQVFMFLVHLTKSPPVCSRGEG